MRTINVGLIGAGGIAQSHCRAISEIEGTRIVAVCDLIRERAEKTAAEWKIPHVYENYHEMLKRESIEAVTVATYNQAHRAPTVDSLRAGKHVLCEKPMAATLDDAAAMTRAARETGKLLMIALKTRYSERMMAAKGIVSSGALGDIYYSETVAARRCGIPGFSDSFLRKETAGIGAVADIGVYCLDHALWLMGHPRPVAVSGIANNVLGKTHRPVRGSWTWDSENLTVEDFGAAWVRFDNGGAMVFKTSWIMHMDDIGGTFFLGTKAGMRLDPLTVFRHEWGLLTDTQTKGFAEVEDKELFRRENTAFADAIREGKPSPIPSEEMLLTNVIIQGLIDSSAAGKELAVSVPEA
ncbi:MAG: Gfo/Idh/MocA family oxidoreductase [Spirochaetia bacterium]|jgi:predicted dehydrogenase